MIEVENLVWRTHMFLIGIIGPTGIERTSNTKDRKFRPKVKKISKIEPVQSTDQKDRKQKNFLDEIAQRKYERMKNRINVIQKHGHIDLYI